MRNVLSYYIRNLSFAGMALLLVGITLDYQLSNHFKKENEKANVKLLSKTLEQLSEVIQKSISDVYFLSSTSSLKTDTFKFVLESDLFLFSQSRNYYQVRILDTLGKEIYRVNYHQGQHQIIEDSLLQDKKHRYYFQEAKELETNQIYISKLDYDYEYGQMVKPKELTFRVIAPLFSNETKVGFVIINQNMNDLISQIYDGTSERITLINQDNLNLTVDSLDGQKIQATINSPFTDLTTIEKTLNFKDVLGDFNRKHGLNLELNNDGWIIARITGIASGLPIIYRLTIYGSLIFCLVAFYAWLVTFRTKNMDVELNRSMKDVLRHEKLLTIRNNQLESFVRIASHDLREPLATINGTARTLLEYEKKPIDKTFTKYIDFITQCVDRMDALTRNVLDYVITGNYSEAEMVNTNSLVNTIEQDLSHAIKQKNGQILYEGLPTIMAFQLELKQIFQNLISNGIKYSKRKKDPIIKISYSELNEFHRFTVDDNGIGITENDSEKIFDMFTRLEKKSEESGLGIGLAITKKLVELHGGVITATSNPEFGTQFSFTISKELNN